MANIKGKENAQKVEETLRNFHTRLKAMLQELNLGLTPASGFKEPVDLSA